MPVNFLFSFVFGFGLTQLQDIFSAEFVLLHFVAICVAYVTILLSWWGYNRAVFFKPYYNNIPNLVVDCLLLFSYWALLNFYKSLDITLWLYLFIYVMYTIWEIIGLIHKSSKKRSLYINILFSLLYLALLLLNMFTFNSESGAWISYSIILILQIFYRILLTNHSKTLK